VVELGDVDFTIALASSRTVRFGEDEAAGLVDMVLGAHGRDRGKLVAVGDVWTLTVGNRGKHMGAVDVRWVPGGTGWTAAGIVEQRTKELDQFKERLGKARERMSAADGDVAKQRFGRQVEHYERKVKAGEEALAEVEANRTAGANELRGRDIALSAELADHPGTAAMVSDTLAKLGDAEGISHNLSAAAPHRAPKTSVYAGAEACRSCHPTQHAQWLTTGHAGAMQSLIADQHAADRDCLGCHVTGWKLDGGPSAPAGVRGLRDVQCEACHGPSRAHMAAPADVKPLRSPDQAVCVTCHDGDRDGGRFDHAVYRPKVSH
jgi:predicted CXXCH cytochrome family protein